ncbi:Uncharacterised protein [Vibrio cholerae]|nr:Uncharacterised protein [Vibrio cholerae]
MGFAQPLLQLQNHFTHDVNPLMTLNLSGAAYADLTIPR